MRNFHGVRTISAVFAGAMTLSVAFLAVLTVIYIRSNADPRWRVFDYNSRQATESEIYHVAEVPSVRAVSFAGNRRLRFDIVAPFTADSWTVVAKTEGKTVAKGRYPEVPFPDEPYTETFTFIPGGVTLTHPIEMTISFYPKEKYAEAGLSWPDNYYTPFSSVPFDLKKPHSIDDWAGLDNNDPDIVEARKILGDTVNMNAPSIERAEQVFTFVMNAVYHSGGTPTDTLLDASPLDTYHMLSSGEGKGFCENRALVYYLFANAAGVKTRLVDVAGKFGPLKLTGHYFCESWDEGQMRWFLVDPMSSVAEVRNARGRLLNTLDIKKLFDTDMMSGCTALYYDPDMKALERRDIEAYDTGNRGYLTGTVVIAYKFGYPRNRSYSAIRHFLTRPTLLYAPIALPNLYRIKLICLYGFFVASALAVCSGMVVIRSMKKNGEIRS